MAELRVRCVDGSCRVVSGARHGHVPRRGPDSWVPAAVRPTRAEVLVAGDYYLARRREEWARAAGAERARLAVMLADGVAELDAAERSGALVASRQAAPVVECDRAHVEFGGGLTGALVAAAAVLVAAGEPGRAAGVLRTAAAGLDRVYARDVAAAFVGLRARVRGR